VLSLFFRKNKQRRSLRFTELGLCLALIFYLMISSLPSTVSAHAYSSSFTEIDFTDEVTEVLFSVDALSIIELVEGIDKNKNGVLEKSELDDEEHHVEELVHTALVIDKDNQQQEAELKGMKIVKKENNEYVTFTFHYPPFFPGDTISLTDGLYFSDEGTNYINLLVAKNRGETSQGVLQGENRTWTILLTELQLEQGETGTKNEGALPSQDPPTKMKTSESSWYSFFKLGMLHILTGYDHLLFLFALLLRKQTFKQYAAIITSFTVAHSITISLAVLGFVELPSRFIEATIAFSICYVAAENLFRKDISHRWGLTFVFGLIHGLGFANILKEMNISKSSLVSSLLSFNLGIEVVQLLLLLLLLPILIYTQKLPYSKKIVQFGSFLIILLGGFWFLERVFS
jgi:hydrogenase/urease accessory protein HupE